MRIKSTFVGLILVSVLLTHQAAATIIASPPDEQVRLSEEHIFVVFDPLTASQTLVVHHVFAPTSVSFGILIPVPAPATTRILRERTRTALDRRFHPVGRPKRVLDVEFESWLKGCLAREIGMPDLEIHTANLEGTLNNRPFRNLGPGVEALHHWLTRNGLTLSPEQVRRLDTLRSMGWHLVALRVEAQDSDRHREQLKGPIMAITHPSEEPVVAPMMQTAAPTDRHLFELSFLSEWSAALRHAPEFEAFYSMPSTTQDLKSLTRKVRNAPWSFRRSGMITAFRNPPSSTDGIMHLGPVDPLPRKKPRPTVSQRPASVVLPTELIFGLPLLCWWIWLRRRRRERLFGRASQRLR